MDLGKSHVAQGVYDEHFDVGPRPPRKLVFSCFITTCIKISSVLLQVVKYALLKTIEEELQGQDNSKVVVSAWSEAYDELVDIIRAEMHLIRASQSPVSA